MDLRFSLGDHDAVEARALGEYLSRHMASGWSAGSVLRTLIAFETAVNSALDAGRRADDVP
jgi:hypothetical protein